MKLEAPGLLKRTILSLYAFSFSILKKKSESMKIPKGFLSGSYEPECLTLTSVPLLLSLILTVVRTENPPKGMCRVRTAALKEPIYSQILITSMYLISQGIHGVSNMALDTQVGLQKKYFV